MKSESLSKYFHTLNRQRDPVMLRIQSLPQEKLWDRKEDGKWSIGEHLCHLYLMIRMLKLYGWERNKWKHSLKIWKMILPDTLCF